MARFDVFIERIEGFAFFVVSVEAGDAGGRKELFELRFKKFSAEAFVEKARRVAGGTGVGDGGLVSTGVTDELVGVGVESEG